MVQATSRRRFIQQSLAASAALTIAAASNPLWAARKDAPFEVSLAQWSLHKSFFDGKLDHLDFAKVTHQEFGIGAIEYVNQFFKEKAKDEKYLAEMNKRAADFGVKQLLIMIDGEGQLGDPDSAKRKQAVENHYRWVDAAKTLGCHSIRVNAGSEGTYDEQKKLAADGLHGLSEYAAKAGLNVIVENHGGLSSNGKWLSETIKSVGLDNCGTLPDFGNFRIADGELYDRYQGVEELMPFAKAVSAKSYDFDDQGNETTIDFEKMMKIVLAHQYHGFVGIEYEGSRLDEYAGIKATKALLDRIRNAA
jgi:L-ribulose-5-phosphate 3-epimerase